METLIPWIVVGAAAAGFVQGLSGFAFSMVALTFWAWTVPPQLAGPLAVFGSLLGQLLAARHIQKGFSLKKALPFVIGGALSVPLGTAILPHIDQTMFKLAVGTLLVLWTPAMLRAKSLPRVSAGGVVADGSVGFAGGVLGGLAGMTGAVPALWALLRGWERDTQRSVLQTSNISMHVLTITAYFTAGLITREAGLLFLVLAPAMLIPTVMGIRLYRAVSDETFRRIVLTLLFASGLILLAAATVRLLA